MNDEFLRPGEGSNFIYKETEFDILERALIRMTSVAEIYQHVTRWILSKLHPSYVVIAVEQEKSGGTGYISVLQAGNTDKIPHFLSDRIRLGISNRQVFVHKTCAISVPYSLGNGTGGFIFLGKPKTQEAFTQSQVRELLPVVRILNKALLACEAHRVGTERKRLEDAFSHYVSPDIVQGVMNNPEKLTLGGEKKFLSCIFTDIEGFTSLSDGMDPAKVVKLLNIYLNEMSQVIISLGGVIDKFEGDAIMAFFGAPKEFKDHAVRCCLAALRMKRMEKLLNDQLMSEKLITKPLVTRVGVNSGDMVIGNIGSLQRLDFTVIGRNVNIASRLENANKSFETGILISGATYELVKDYFDCRRIGRVQLRGISVPIETFELCGQKEGVSLKYDNFPTFNAYEDMEDIAEELEEI